MINQVRKEMHELENRVEETINQLFDIEDDIKVTLSHVDKKTLEQYRLANLLNAVEKAKELLLNDINYFDRDCLK